MLFSSYIFLFYFLPACLLSYYLVPPKAKNFVLLIFSLFFYSWGSPNIIPLLIFSCFIDYKLAKNWGSKYKKQLLWLGLAVNIISLSYYKYFNFFIKEFNSFLSYFNIPELASLNIVLPVGISFFTFHKISYLVDSYRNPQNISQNFKDYLLYIAFFPQLIAGPIIKYHDINQQIEKRTHNTDKFHQGVIRFSIGIFKKIIIADNLAPIADFAFSYEPLKLDLFVSWVGIIAYSMQLYYDFTGYSDMAIGLALMFGFKIPENFNKPYTSKSITEFWSRWHISLSSWMKEYIYIPLGGNRISEFRTYINLWIVFLISGIWHGDNWTFVCWGLLHGLFITLDKIFYLKFISKFKNNSIFIFINFVLLLFSWVLFRANNLQHATGYIMAMLGFSEQSLVYYRAQLITDRSAWTLLFALLIAFCPLQLRNLKISKHESAIGFASLILLLFAITCLTSSSFSPFLYFKF